jgi:hypothetical protein
VSQAFLGAKGGLPYGPGGGGGRHSPYAGKMNLHLVTDYGTFFLPSCWAPKKQPIAAVVYFFSFALVAGYVLMSLFIGAVCGGALKKMI